MRFRVDLRVPQRLGAHDVELDVVAAEVEVAPHERGEVVEVPLLGERLR